MSFIEAEYTIPPPETLLFQLSKAVGFTAAQLEENRKGKLESGQMRKLAPRVIRPLIVAILMMAVPLPLRIAHGVFVEQEPFAKFWHELFGRAFFENLFGGGGLTGVMVSISCGLMALIAVRVLAKIPYSLLLDMAQGRVLMVQGKVEAKEAEVTMLRGDTMSVYHYVVQKVSFRVNRQAHDTLGNGLEYRVYYTPRSKMLLSIEPKLRAAAAGRH